MLPKMTDDTFEPQAFWPISLLNESLKILGKILGNRINQYLGTKWVLSRAGRRATTFGKCPLFISLTTVKSLVFSSP